MLIDWFTVAAQALNFIILVWLMKRVLYKPIMAAIAARESLVAAELAGAAAKMNSADEAAEEFKRKQEGLEDDRATLLAQAVEEAKGQARTLLDAARVTADGLKTRARDALLREAKDLRECLKDRAQLAFLNLSRRALKDLADATLEAQLTAVFCKRLRSLKTEDKAKLDLAIQAHSQSVSLRSAFPLPPNLQSTLQAAIDSAFERPTVLRFEVVPALVCGIELTAEGQRVGWSIAEYLAALEIGLTEAIPAAPTANLNSPPSNANLSPPTRHLALT